MKMTHIRYLPVEREIENYYDDIFINDNDLPDDKTNYLTLNNTNVDWTIITYGDKIYNGIMDEVKWVIMIMIIIPNCV